MIGRSVIQLCAVIFSNAGGFEKYFQIEGGAAPRVEPFTLLVARPYNFLDVGLDFQVKKTMELDRIEDRVNNNKHSIHLSYTISRSIIQKRFYFVWPRQKKSFAGNLILY